MTILIPCLRICALAFLVALRNAVKYPVKTEESASGGKLSARADKGLTVILLCSQILVIHGAAKYRANAVPKLKQALYFKHLCSAALAVPGERTDNSSVTSRVVVR